MSNSRWGWQTRQVRRDTARPLGGSDPGAHTRDDAAPGGDEWGGARPAPTVTRSPATPASLLDSGFGWTGRGSGTMPIPGTADDAAGHTGDNWGGWEARPESMAGIHDVDQGDGLSRLQRPPLGTDGLTPETELRSWAPTISAGSRAALTRGSNPYPENNPATVEYPDGYRFGARVMRWNNRRMYRPRIVHHDRPAPIRTAAGPKASPALPGGSRLTSPVAWNTFSRSRMFAGAPIVRRQPEPADYSTQGADPAPAGSQFVVI